MKSEAGSNVVEKEAMIHALDTKGLFSWLSPIFRILAGAQDSGTVDIGDILNALRGTGLDSIEINSRSLYELIDGAILDKKISQTPEADAFLVKLRLEILNQES